MGREIKSWEPDTKHSEETGMPGSSRAAVYGTESSLFPEAIPVDPQGRDIEVIPGWSHGVEDHSGSSINSEQLEKNRTNIDKALNDLSHNLDNLEEDNDILFHKDSWITQLEKTKDD